MFGYLMETHDAVDLVEEDPFGGEGVFLPSALSSAEEILGKVTGIFGIIPAIAFPSRGAWAYAPSLPGGALDRWGEPP